MHVQGIGKAARGVWRNGHLSGRESHITPLREVPSAPPPEALHDDAPAVCQLRVNGVPVTASAGAEIEAVNAAC